MVDFFFPRRYLQESVIISMCGLLDMKIGTFAHILSQKNCNLTGMHPRYRLRHSKISGFRGIFRPNFDQKTAQKSPKIRVFWNVWASILAASWSNSNFFCSKCAQWSQFSHPVAYTLILWRALSNIDVEKKSLPFWHTSGRFKLAGVIYISGIWRKIVFT